MTPEPDRPPFVVLWREFLGQFFASESATSDVRLQQMMIWVLAFLLTPGLFITFLVLPWYEIAVLRAKTFGDPALVELILLLLGAIFVTWAMVTIGLIAVAVWESLSFDRRDAMVLGPLPLRGSTIVGAKLAALAAFLLGTAAAVNLMTAVPFAFVTSNREGATLIGQFVAHMAATMGGSTFVFASLVAARGTLLLAGGARLAASTGAALQFLAVGTLLTFVTLIPSMPERVRSMDLWLVAWAPPAWFLGLFQQLSGSTDAGHAMLAGRAVVATTAAVLLAVATTVVGVRRQMRLALAPSASAGALGGAWVARSLARLLTGRDAVARAVAEFVLLTLARCRPQQATIAMNAAIGLAVVAIVLAGRLGDPAALARPRTAVLWVPLVFAYWLSIGVRASCYVPSELPAAWAFRLHRGDADPSEWLGVRAAVAAYLLPRVLGLTALLVPLVGWRVAAWHALLVCAIAMVLAGVVASTLPGLPFTRPYAPGHAKLRTRWPLYIIGLLVVCYWPVRIELRLLGSPGDLMVFLAVIAALAAVVEVAGRRSARRPPPVIDPDEDPTAVTVLGIAGTG